MAVRAAAAVSSRAAYTARGAASPVLTGWEAATATANWLTALSLPAWSTALAYTLAAVGAKGPVYRTHSVPS